MAGLYETETFAAVIAADGNANDPETWLMATGHGGRSQEADADHAAGMHPGVALAVADWLDRFGDKLYCYGPREFDHALAIARAYLGTDAPRDALTAPGRKQR
jgi:hypothetical protein